MVGNFWLSEQLLCLKKVTDFQLVRKVSCQRANNTIITCTSNKNTDAVFILFLNSFVFFIRYILMISVEISENPVRYFIVLKGKYRVN